MAAVLVFAAAPPRPLSAPVDRPDANTIAGAYHVHTTRSDGALDRDGVARAAAAAGLRFVVFTDHGDGTRTPDPPAYLHGILCIDAVEISTNDGHLVALGIGQSPYPLGGDGVAVVEDVARLGGAAIVAHPFSPRRELAWHDWAIPVDGLEWLNADSEWRDEDRVALARSLAGYLIRPAGALASLLDRPAAALDAWDLMTPRERVVSLAAHDAHGGLGAENGDTRGRRLHVPSYEATFRSFSTRAVLAKPLGGDPLHDADLLLAALRAGSSYTVVDALAAPGALSFQATAGTVVARMGENMPPSSGPARFDVDAEVPDGAVTRLLHNGRVVAERSGGVLDFVAGDPGSYRVEVQLAGAPGASPVPWLVSNPIFRLAPPATASTPVFEDVPLPAGPWRTEESTGSTGTVGDPQFSFQYELAGGPPASQFAALVRDVAAAPDFSALTFRTRADRPTRVSLQLRFASEGNRRWRRSFYSDATDREVRIPLAQLRPADAPGPLPDTSRLTSILFVVDLVNAQPGAGGSVTIHDLRLVR